jgi:hypothetical protein
MEMGAGVIFRIRALMRARIAVRQGAWDMDNFHEAVRHAVRLAWGDAKTRQKLRVVISGEDAVWGCGESANRLCYLLAGDEMKTVVGTGYNASNDGAMRLMYRSMQSAYGRLVARVQLRHSVAGHAFVWVSRETEVPHTLEGYIYQTNIGIKTQEFDLLEWINDSKSEESVFFPAYITQLQATFGTNLPGQGESGERAAVYATDFFTESKKMPETAKKDMTEATAGSVRLLWKAVEDGKALNRFGDILRED